MPKTRLGENPLDALVGSPTPERSGSDKHVHPAVTYRLPPELVEAMRSVARTEGVEISQVVAYALTTFLKRYRDGEKLPTRPSAKREVELPR